MNVSISIFAIFLILLLLEVIFRIVFPQDLSGSWRMTSERGYLLNKASWKVKHQLKERILYYRFNNLHLRGENIDHSKFKILALGDSFTFGWLLKEEDTYISLLQSYADKTLGKDQIQFLNGGAGGWGTADHLDYLTEFGDRVKPNMVIVYFNAGDIARSINRFTVHNPNSVLFKMKVVFRYSRFYQWLLENSHLIQWVRNKIVIIHFLIKDEGDRNKKRMTNNDEKIIIPGSEIKTTDVNKVVVKGQKLFEKINNWCVKRNIPFVVLTTGWHFDYFYNRNEKTNSPNIAFLQKAEEFFRTNEIFYYELTPDLIKEMGNNKEDYIIKGDFHPNEKAAKIISNYSWEYLLPIISPEFNKWKNE